MTILISTLTTVSCINDMLQVKDNTLTAHLEIMTPVVGYGGTLEIRLTSSCDNIAFTEVACRYPLLVNGSELVRYQSYSCGRTGLRITSSALKSDSNEEIAISLTIRDDSTGQSLTLDDSFSVTAEQITIPKSITGSVSEVMLNPSGRNTQTHTATVRLTFSPEDCDKDYILTYSREDWKEMIEVRQEKESFTIEAPRDARAGDITITVTSKYNSFVSTDISVKVRKDVALVITGTTCGDKARVTWNRYDSYLFTSLYCYIAEWEGDIEGVMRSNSKDASNLSFKISQSSFDYNVEYTVERIRGGELKKVKFPYRCLSNAHMSLSVIYGHINAESDRKTRDHDTEYQYYTLKVSDLSYDSELYNIRYIVHLYKAKKDGHWIVCNDFSSGYALEKNKYWYAAADTDEWIIERD